MIKGSNMRTSPMDPKVRAIGYMYNKVIHVAIKNDCQRWRASQYLLNWQATWKDFTHGLKCQVQHNANLP